MTVRTVRLTVAQALVRILASQRLYL